MRNRSDLPIAVLFSVISLLSPGSASAADRTQAADPSVSVDGPAARADDAAMPRKTASSKPAQAESVEAAGGASTKRVLVIGAVVLAVAALAILIGMGGGGGSSGGGY